MYPVQYITGKDNDNCNIGYNYNVYPEARFFEALVKLSICKFNERKLKAEINFEYIFFRGKFNMAPFVYKHLQWRDAIIVF